MAVVEEVEEAAADVGHRQQVDHDQHDPGIETPRIRRVVELD